MKLLFFFFFLAEDAPSASEASDGEESDVSDACSSRDSSAHDVTSTRDAGTDSYYCRHCYSSSKCNLFIAYGSHLCCVYRVGFRFHANPPE